MKRIALSVLVIVAACDQPVDVDNWGPPAGFARIVGTVQWEDGTPIQAAEILVSACGSPIGGVAGSGISASDGSFDVEARLPPVGVMLPLNLDTLRTPCTVGVARGLADVAVELSWAASAAQAPVHEVNVQVTN